MASGMTATAAAKATTAETAAGATQSIAVLDAATDSKVSRGAWNTRIMRPIRPICGDCVASLSMKRLLPFGDGGRHPFRGDGPGTLFRPR